MAGIRPQRGSVAWVFILLGPTLTIMFALTESLIRSILTPGDVSFMLVAFALGSDPLVLTKPWLLLMLPFGLAGLVAFKLDGRVNGLKFIAACTTVGAALALLHAPLFGASLELSSVLHGSLAALACALVTRVRGVALLPRS